MTPTHGPEEPAGLSASTRRRLATLARRRRTRVSSFTPDRPIDWRPEDVRRPGAAFDTHFGEDSAWRLIADRLEQGEPLEIVRLRQPKGVKGYVMKIDLEPDAPRLYVKLELGSRKVIGRSFHYSEHD